MKLKDKVAIITGAGRGIGRATAELMSKEGASLVLISISKQELKETMKLIDGRAVSIAGDVAKPKDVRKTVDETIATFGRIDILVNNAAVRGPVCSIHEIDEISWHKTFNVNLYGVYYFIRAVVPHMIKNSSGKIINMTSGLADMVMPPLGMYSITKAALNHMTRIMAEELKPYNIQANCLDPGSVDTRMSDELRALGPQVLGSELYDELNALKESGYIMPPEYTAEMCLYLASEDSGTLTGEVLSPPDYHRVIKE